MRTGTASLLAATAAISALTIANRLRAVSLGRLAATPTSVADGHVWLLLTSAFVADRPAVPSVIGFLLVGLVTLAVCGGRVLWLSAAGGHVGATLAVYLVLGLVRLPAPGAFQHVLSLRDYGTSAVIAAWIGAVSYRWWTRGGGVVDRAGVVALCTVSGAIGWAPHSNLTVLDSEHAVALALGAAAARYGPRLELPVRIRRRPEAVGGRPSLGGIPVSRP